MRKGGGREGFGEEKGEHRFEGNIRFEAEDSNEGKRSSRNGEFQLYFTLYTFIKGEGSVEDERARVVKKKKK